MLEMSMDQFDNSHVLGQEQDQEVDLECQLMDLHPYLMLLHHLILQAQLYPHQMQMLLKGLQSPTHSNANHVLKSFNL